MTSLGIDLTVRLDGLCSFAWCLSTLKLERSQKGEPTTLQELIDNHHQLNSNATNAWGRRALSESVKGWEEESTFAHHVGPCHGSVDQRSRCERVRFLNDGVKVDTNDHYALEAVKVVD